MKNATYSILTFTLLLIGVSFASCSNKSNSKEILAEEVFDYGEEESIEKNTTYTQTNKEQKIDFSEIKHLSILAFKEEQKLQIYTKKNNTYTYLKEYPFTGYVGQLGPKLKQRDYQIPEGIYKVISLNPESKYHLSIEINYPNKFDYLKSKLLDKSKLGGNIFIHGGSLTIGCIPIGNYAIEEVYALAEKSIDNEIEVIISPRDFRINSEFPKVENIDWEEELYQKINNRLNEYQIPTQSSNLTNQLEI